MALAFLLLSTYPVVADTGVPAVPEIQGLSTATNMNVQGTVTETDAGAWTTTHNPLVIDQYTVPMGPIFGEMYYVLFDQLGAQLRAAGGSITGTYVPEDDSYANVVMNVPESLLNIQVAASSPDPETWQEFLDFWTGLGMFSGPVVMSSGIHQGTLDAGQVQYTTGYNDQYAGISGQQTFSKSLALSTANKIADQSNIKANTNIQYLAIDSGRATRAEDLLVDGASQAQDSSDLILCPFSNANPGIIPAFCNIEQAGSSFDTTLTSTVTSADTRFVGTDASVPVVMNYNINAQGITLGNQSSPMIGSVSAYLKVHVQESRNESSVTIPDFDTPPYDYLVTVPDEVNPVKSEDIAYSETSTASGLISRFSKPMSYSSQASAVQAPVPVIPVEEE